MRTSNMNNDRDVTTRVLPEGDWRVGRIRTGSTQSVNIDDDGQVAVNATIYIDHDFSEEWRETLCGWLEARGINPSDVYRLRVTRRWAHLYMYRLNLDGDKYVVGRWGRRYVARMRMKVRNR